MNDLSNPHIRVEMARRIFDDYNAASVEIFTEEPRKYLGASAIGGECERDLWYDFRWFRRPSFDGRMLRLFQRGHREEPFAIRHLRNRGFTVNEIDPETGKQFRFSGIHGHFGGGCDGRGFLPVRYNYANEVGFEFKTANEKQFAKFKKEGVRKWKPKYAAQMDVYGRAWELRYFVFAVVNKNNDDVWFEIYECDWANADAMLARGFRIVGSRVPPAKLAASPTFTVCKYCDSAGVCHGQRMPPRNCRTCSKSIPSFNGQWHCEHADAIIPPEIMPNGCDMWAPIQ